MFGVFFSVSVRSLEATLATNEIIFFFCERQSLLDIEVVLWEFISCGNITSAPVAFFKLVR